MNQSIIWKTALQSILKNKRRSMLTMLGIVIGIASVITIVAIGNGFKADTINRLDSEKQATNEKKIRLTQFNKSDAFSEEALFTENDLAIIQQVDGIQKAAFDKKQVDGVSSGTLTFKAGDKSLSVNYNVLKETKLNLLTGRQLGELDEATAGKSVVIDEVVAKELYPDAESALNKEFYYNDQIFTIVGVANNTSGAISASNDEPLIFFPEAAYTHYFGDMIDTQTAVITILPDYDASQVTAKVLAVLTNQGALKNTGVYEEYNLKDSIKQFGSLLDNLTLFISAVAAISLVIAGVGVMNMMYISVSERIKEIGIRRALGATSGDIKSQFLTEGIALTLLGGIIGYLLGMIIAYLASFALPFSVHPDILTVVLAIGISVAIGVTFSYFPAAAAAKKDLIDIMK